MPRSFKHWKNTFNPEHDPENPEIIHKLGLSKRQKDWISNSYHYYAVKHLGISPDDNKPRCFFPVWDDEGGWCHCLSCTDSGEYIRSDSKSVELHHIWAKGHMSYSGCEDPDVPTNIIPICRRHHVLYGYSGSLNWRCQLVEGIHPDIEYARRNYRGNQKPTSYDKVFEGRKELIANGLTYWNTDFDSHLRQIAEEVHNTYVLEGMYQDWFTSFPYYES